MADPCQEARGTLAEYVEYLNHIEQLFPAGRKKEDVLQAIINLHRSTKRWRRLPASKREPSSSGQAVEGGVPVEGRRWRCLVIDQPPGEDVRFRVHIDERRYTSKDNMVIMRTGTETEMLAALDADLQAALNEGWKLEG